MLPETKGATFMYEAFLDIYRERDKYDYDDVFDWRFERKNYLGSAKINNCVW